MSEFKVGDRVKVRKDYRIKSDHKYGEIVGAFGVLGYDVVFSDAEKPKPTMFQGWRYYDYELKPDKREAVVTAEVIKEDDDDYAVILELGEYEAGVLLRIVRLVGGPPNGPRGVADHIRRTLVDATVEEPKDLVSSGSIALGSPS